jgi:hypothetical protein
LPSTRLFDAVGEVRSTKDANSNLTHLKMNARNIFEFIILSCSTRWLNFGLLVAVGDSSLLTTGKKAFCRKSSGGACILCVPPSIVISLRSDAVISAGRMVWKTSVPLPAVPIAK